MKNSIVDKRLIPSLIGIFFVASTAFSQNGADSDSPLRLLDFVEASLVEGTSYTIDEKVSNDGFWNIYTVSSDFETFVVHGTLLLKERLQEIGAIAELKKLNAVTLVAEGAVDWAKDEGRSLSQVVRHPSAHLELWASGIASPQARSRLEDLGWIVREETVQDEDIERALANATYTGIYEDPVRLQNGRWEGEPYVEDGASRPSVGLIEEFRLFGDLTGDESEEVVVTLWESTGGSGTRSYVAVMSYCPDGIENLGTALIGDRVQLRSGRVTNGRIELEVIQQGPGDAACCPSQKATRTWVLGVDALEEREARVTGTVALSDLEGPKWVLIRLGSETLAPSLPEISLTLDGDRFVGQSACNRYFVEPQEGDLPGELRIGPIGATQMACPEEVMNLEDRYLDALSKVTQFGFRNGRLVLTWKKDGAHDTLIFTEGSR